jgi:hypothetical protein
MATNSTVPAIYGLREYVDTMNTLTHEIPERLVRGRTLFLLSVADSVRKAVMSRAPDIEMGNKMFPYAEHLRIGIVDGVSDEEAVAIYFENQSLVLDATSMDGKALYFQPTARSPAWVNVLMIYGPWPSHMVPVPSEGLNARVISRNAREDELKALWDRIYARRGQIETDLRRAGAANVRIDKTSNAVGIVVREDVGYNILRSEFGYNDSKQVAHWRPALKGIEDLMPDLMKRYFKYLETGREAVFDLPKDVDNVRAETLNKGAKFARILAPFAPKG